MTNQNLIEIENEPLHFGHLGAIFSVALLLLGISWFKHPDLFQFGKESQNSALVSSLPRYYAYETPAELNQPLVAGASTQGQGPMIIGEDGSLTPATDVGDVLGLSTEDYNLTLEQIKVTKIVPATLENQKEYINITNALENEFVNTQSFQEALVSLDQRQIDAQVKKIEKVIASLNEFSVPDKLLQLHKLKLLQYHAAIIILKNFTQADSNPELVSTALSVFLKAQQDIDGELEIIQKTLTIYE